MTVDTSQNPPITDPSHQLPEHGVDSRRSKIWWLIVLLVLLIVLIVAAVLLWKHHEAATKKKPAPPKIPVTTATAKKGDIGVYLDEIGTVTPVYTASITSEVGGQVVAVHFKEGQIVRKGDPLIDIDARPYRATLLQAQGALERDENVLAQAKMDLQRYQEAWARRAIAKQQMDDQEKIVLQDEGTVKNDQGTVQYDEVQVEFCHIIAPISGRVGLRLVDPGNVVQASGTVTLAVITQLEPITVIFTIPEDSLGPVAARLKKNAKLNVDAFDRTAQKKIASGTLLTLDNQIDTTTGTVKARSVFANKDDALFPNQFVNVRLLVNTLQAVTLVPAAAIQQNGQSSFVYVIQNNVSHNRPVKVGVTDAGMTQVDGVNPGDIVATSSFDKLQENTAVAISNKDSNKNSNNTSSGPASSNTSGSSAP